MERLKFLVDVGVGKKIEEWLSDKGYDTLTVRELNPSMADHDILQIAIDEHRMVVTMDKDFGEFVYRKQKSHSGIFLLRLENVTGIEKVKTIVTVQVSFRPKGEMIGAE